MSEKFPNEENIPSLSDFKKEVAGLKKQEEENLNEDGTRKTAHFKEINPDELTEADQKLHRKLLSGELIVDELRNYQNKLSESGNQSQKDFSAYVANKLFIQMYKKKE
ncbi:MAG: hypothetical protein Q8R34_01370 [bacterium]|nr:hypothetical protein [bacterium]